MKRLNRFQTFFARFYVKQTPLFKLCDSLSGLIVVVSVVVAIFFGIYKEFLICFLGIISAITFVFLSICFYLSEDWIEHLPEYRPLEKNWKKDFLNEEE